MKKLLALLSVIAMSFLFVFTFKNEVRQIKAEAYEINVKMSGHGEDKLIFAEEGDYLLDTLNEAQYSQGLFFEDENSYLSGLIDKDPASYSSEAELNEAVKAFTKSVASYEAKVTGAMDLYTIWTNYPAEGIEFGKIKDQKLDIKDNFANLGKYSFPNFPSYLFDGRYAKVEVELNHSKLINQSNTTDEVDFKFVDKLIEASIAIVDNQEIFLFDFNKIGAKKFSEISADCEYVYLDSSASQNNFDDALVNEINGKIFVCNSGDISNNEKINTALSFGAVGVIICNNEPGYIRSSAEYQGDYPAAMALVEAKQHFVDAGEKHFTQVSNYYIGTLTLNLLSKNYPIYRNENDLYFYYHATDKIISSEDIIIEIDSSKIKQDAYYEAEITYRIGGAHLQDNEIELKPRNEKTIISIGNKPVQPDEPSDPATPSEEPTQNEGLPTGAIVGIVVGSTVVVGVGGFSISWFGIQKKTLKQLFKAIKNIIKKIFKRKEKKNKIN